MGEVAQASEEAGAPTIGLIPTHLLNCEQGRRNLSRLVFTEDMHEPKKGDVREFRRHSGHVGRHGQFL